MLTVDANVFVSAASTAEVQHMTSIAFFERVLQASEELYCSALVLPEIAASTVSNLNQFPGLTLIVVDSIIANMASEIALKCRLRGADAIYAAVAQKYGTTLWLFAQTF